MDWPRLVLAALPCCCENYGNVAICEPFGLLELGEPLLWAVQAFTGCIWFSCIQEPILRLFEALDVQREQ
ncbi:hypothetical protein D3879_15990 [Pseudomonas cavernicola]|uniref:Uncharacterized protein n=1 Tax=Pseudomonas cavernicola TaxID=2320866 RepID=A0A418XEE9_9PSED|nr:hypothetical protein D3879_15990 [Pseudomonas cavernicola]